MDDREIRREQLEGVCDAVRAWSRVCGEERPKNVRVVYTTHKAATELLHPGVTAGDHPCYFVTLEGKFDLPTELDAPRRTGVWAALYINPETLQVSSLTVRPSEYIPDPLPLERLGIVYAVGAD
ncbi:hypothetical protein ACFY1P_16085 [Streptomyces sp. NPDC001407]|uniref:hypothetical protein n=1 Tax=Streptomyces sp. NPDC001407 TaxID=3364573 RepID=UPI003694060E